MLATLNTSSPATVFRLPPALESVVEPLVVDGADVTLRGDSTSATHFEGAAASRLFEVRGGGVLVLQDVHVSGGRVHDAEGGCILVQGSSFLRLVRARVLNCATNGVSAGGGAISASSSTVDLVDSTVEDSKATDSESPTHVWPRAVGGGLHGVSSTIRLTRSCITGCLADGYGGAARLQDGELIVIASNISDCLAGRNGGGVAAVYGAAFYFQDSLMARCHAEYAAGAVFNLVSDLYFSNSEVTGCDAVIAGGAIYSEAFGPSAVSLLRTVFSGCVAGQRGGALTSVTTPSLQQATTITADHCRFVQCKVVFNQTHIDRHHEPLGQFPDAPECRGGAVDVSNAELVLNNTLIVACEAFHYYTTKPGLDLGNMVGGGVSITGESNAVVQRCEIIHCRALNGAGGFLVARSALVIIDTAFMDNHVNASRLVIGPQGGPQDTVSPNLEAAGGCLTVTSYATLLIRGNSSFSLCSAAIGGAINLKEEGELHMTGGTITGCTALVDSSVDKDSGGGALHLNAATAMFIGSLIEHCHSNYRGGAFLLLDLAKVVLFDVRVSRNSVSIAEYGAGGVAAVLGKTRVGFQPARPSHVCATLSRSFQLEIICFWLTGFKPTAGGTMIAVGCIFDQNSAPSGGVFFAYRSDVEVVLCEFVDNYGANASVAFIYDGSSSWMEFTLVNISQACQAVSHPIIRHDTRVPVAGQLTVRGLRVATCSDSNLSALLPPMASCQDKTYLDDRVGVAIASETNLCASSPDTDIGIPLTLCINAQVLQGATPSPAALTSVHCECAAETHPPSIAELSQSSLSAGVAFLCQSRLAREYFDTLVPYYPQSEAGGCRQSYVALGVSSVSTELTVEVTKSASGDAITSRTLTVAMVGYLDNTKVNWTLFSISDNPKLLLQWEQDLVSTANALTYSIPIVISASGLRAQAEPYTAEVFVRQETKYGVKELPPVIVKVYLQADVVAAMSILGFASNGACNGLSVPWNATAGVETFVPVTMCDASGFPVSAETPSRRDVELLSALLYDGEAAMPSWNRTWQLGISWRPEYRYPPPSLPEHTTPPPPTTHHHPSTPRYVVNMTPPQPWRPGLFSLRLQYNGSAFGYQANVRVRCPPGLVADYSSTPASCHCPDGSEETDSRCIACENGFFSSASSRCIACGSWLSGTTTGVLESPVGIDCTGGKLRGTMKGYWADRIIDTQNAAEVGAWPCTPASACAGGLAWPGCSPGYEGVLCSGCNRTGGWAKDWDGSCTKRADSPLQGLSQGVTNLIAILVACAITFFLMVCQCWCCVRTAGSKCRGRSVAEPRKTPAASSHAGQTVPEWLLDKSRSKLSKADLQRKIWVAREATPDRHRPTSFGQSLRDQLAQQLTGAEVQLEEEQGEGAAEQIGDAILCLFLLSDHFFHSDRSVGMLSAAVSLGKPVLLILMPGSSFTPAGPATQRAPPADRVRLASLYG